MQVESFTLIAAFEQLQEAVFVKLKTITYKVILNYSRFYTINCEKANPLLEIS